MDHIDYKFMEFVTKHGKSYGTREEYDFRAAIFRETFKFVEEHNASETETHKAEVNEMSDWTSDEWARILGYQVSDRVRNPETLDESTLADEIDWVKKGAVTPVITRDTADHAGHSLPPEPLRELTSTSTDL
jgi:hypothetical protein